MKPSPKHPRFKSLLIRDRLVEGFQRGIVVPQGLIAHGRGEAFDYLLGETTTQSAARATRVAAALLLAAKNPVISVNGNTAALVPRDIVRLARSVPAGVEVNLFHNSSVRERRIFALLKRHGAPRVFGANSNPKRRILGVASPRGLVDPSGIGEADVVLVPLEDGDRTQALRAAGKAVIAIDLNPISRTSRTATVTIVDNIVRALPALIQATIGMKSQSTSTLKAIMSGFNNQRNLAAAMAEMLRYLQKWTGR